MTSTRVLVMAVLLLDLTLAFAIPQQMSFNGQLTTSGGAPLDTTVAITFRIFDASAGGTVLWEEAHPAVAVSGGVFHALLGSVTALPDVFNTSCYLGVSIGSDTEMSPRHQIVSVGHAYRVATVDAAAGGSIFGDTHITGKLKVGPNHTNDGQRAFVVGQNNHADGSYTSVTGGVLNWAVGGYSHVGGGQQNRAGDGSGDYQTVGGGVQNHASAYGSVVAGGAQDSARGQYSTISGGELNTAWGFHSVIGGGKYNRASGAFSVVGGGGGPNAADSNAAHGVQNVIGGGYRNTSSDTASTVGGGWNNQASGSYATVGGGRRNVVNNLGATVGGGRDNQASGLHAAVCGGDSNLAQGQFAAIAGGADNLASGSGAAIAGGWDNEASGIGAFVAGMNNSATAGASAVGGGELNTASGSHAVVSGGSQNTASGNYSIAAGGNNNQASATYSFAAGQGAHAFHNGSFVWCSGGTVTLSSADNSFVARSPGGVRFYSTASGLTGVSLTPGAAAWGSICDSTKKERYGRVNTNEVLEKLVQLPIETWSYKEDPNRITHMGPMAQDFWNAFRLGESDTTINTLDPAGVMMAAIQELAKENSELKERLARLEAQLQGLADNRKTAPEGN